MPRVRDPTISRPTVTCGGRNTVLAGMCNGTKALDSPSPPPGMRSNNIHQQRIVRGSILSRGNNAHPYSTFQSVGTNTVIPLQTSCCARVKQLFTKRAFTYRDHTANRHRSPNVPTLNPAALDYYTGQCHAKTVGVTLSPPACPQCVVMLHTALTPVPQQPCT
jgi:hypothetical protein